MVEIDESEVAKKLFPTMPNGFPFKDFEVEELILPSDDDMGIVSDDESIAEEDLKVESGFESIIVISNIPKVTSEKFDKLKGVLTKVFNNPGTVREGGLYIPLDANQTTKGFCFVEYGSAKEANNAVELLNNFKLDKNHVFQVNKFDDLDRFAKVPVVYEPRTAPEYKAPDMLPSWMLDRLGRDEFVLNSVKDRNTRTMIMWNDGKRSRSELAYDRTSWTQSFVQWSPRGTVIATLHTQGIAIWGGPKFDRLRRFSHKDVRLIDFSPNEKYLVSYSGSGDDPNKPGNVLLNVFDVTTGKNLRYFEAGADNFGPQIGAFKWPVFKWAGGKDDLYFARLGKDSVYIFQAPDMGLLDKAPLKLVNVQDFEWSPSDPIMALYTSEMGNQPARIVLYKIPEKKEIRQKALFDVHNTKIFWHPQGDYLAVLVERTTKSKKSFFMGFEVFRLRGKDVPIEVFELPNKNERVLSLAWEPKGHRCAIVHGEGSKLNVSLYSMRDEKGRPVVKHLTTLPNRPCNRIFWSPQGKNLVLAGIRNPAQPHVNGQLEFYSAEQLDTMGTAEHFMMSGVEWDPTGRYVATSATSQSVESGFNVWSFQGKQLYGQQYDGLTQFSWRPRQPSLLSPTKETEIAKSLKALSKKYDEEDEALLQQADEDVLAERRRQMDEWLAFVQRKESLRSREHDFVVSTLGPRAAERPFRLQTVQVEQVLEVKEEPYNI